MLTDSIAHGVSGISGSLFSLSIISNETYQEMMNTSRTGHNKASILIDDLSNGIKLNPETFHKFVAALKEDGPWTENIVSHVLEAYSNIKASGTVGQPTIFCVFLHISRQLSLFLHHPMQLHLNHKGPHRIVALMRAGVSSTISPDAMV